MANKGVIFRVLYLFAGKARKSNVGVYLEGLRNTLVNDWQGIWEIEEVDIDRDEGQDLLDADFRQALLDKISAGFYNFMLCSPPCSTFSRAVYANVRGPRPVRSRQFPLGLPHLTANEQ